MADTQTVTINHALFWYADSNGIERVATHGETIEVNAADYERGQKHGAFTNGSASQEPAELTEFPVDASEEEQIAWVSSANLADITAYVAEHPEHADDILAAEELRGDKARSTMSAAVAAGVGSSDS